LIWKN